MAAHHCQFRIYYEDTDAGGIVYHARYLGFAERARAEALRSLGLGVGEMAEQDGIGFVVRQLGIRYHAPLRLDELMDVETVLLQMSGARLNLRQVITNLSRAGQKSVVIEVELACLKLAGMSPLRLLASYREKLSGLTVPEERSA
ncbi:YbgC/FadM family acyl-CoA thioesterase [Bombella apis]|uniref:YbgC/FadM family acyl-CoA thioesterase n=1 Tax=Bombella apis TaxID=1785988 RepID=A0ABR9MLW0_9PROT|nr:YbgC/FadM family acyl-CoA thioesterase [Bombella apis]MBE1722847.1 YbgC/FadM family acyl-CoA thioesterase [Bombella apis]MBR9730652.1 YbgC/FadM family acyl-CoA thioesterase [Bombella apis]